MISLLERLLKGKLHNDRVYTRKLMSTNRYTLSRYRYVRSEYGNLWETHQCRPHAYGHTWSPGYELPAGMLHGHAVATGMGFGAYLSFCEDWISQEELDRILKLLSGLELSLWHPIMDDSLKIFKAQEKMIEKRGGNLAAPIPKGIGNCGYLNHMPLELLQLRLQAYREICQQFPRQGLGIEAHCKEVGLEDPATVGGVNKELPEETVMEIQNGSEKDGCENGMEETFMEIQNGSEKDGCENGLDNNNSKKRKSLTYQEWIEAVQKKRNKGFVSNLALKQTKDLPHPPEFEHNEICHSGKYLDFRVYVYNMVRDYTNKFTGTLQILTVWCVLFPEGAKQGRRLHLMGRPRCGASALSSQCIFGNS